MLVKIKGVKNKLFRIAQTFNMAKGKRKKFIRKVVEDSASANEFTGALQKINLDPDEVKKFHEKFNEKK